MVQLPHPLLSVPLPAAALHDAVGEQRRVGVVVGARGGGHAADVTRAGGAARAAGGAAFGRRQVVLDDLGGRDGGSEVSGKRCISCGDGVPVDWDEALVGLRHGHGGPGCDLSHLARRGHGLGRVQVPRRGCGEARVAEVADGAGAQRGGLGGRIASTTRGRAGAGVGGAFPGPQAGVNVLEAWTPRRSLLPAFSHQAVKPEGRKRRHVGSRSSTDARVAAHNAAYLGGQSSGQGSSCLFLTISITSWLENP